MRGDRRAAEALLHTANHVAGAAAVERAIDIDRQRLAVRVDDSELQDARQLECRAARHRAAAVEAHTARVAAVVAEDNRAAARLGDSESARNSQRHVGETSAADAFTRDVAFDCGRGGTGAVVGQRRTRRRRAVDSQIVEREGAGAGVRNADRTAVAADFEVRVGAAARLEPGSRKPTRGAAGLEGDYGAIADGAERTRARVVVVGRSALEDDRARETLSRIAVAKRKVTEARVGGEAGAALESDAAGIVADEFVRAAGDPDRRPGTGNLAERP